ncbi:MAG: hypothetical protein J1F23_03195 [Oscillospiraceae bacterium]|nr:hypothetical protein [Oscillospiraceae bacterium]
MKRACYILTMILIPLSALLVFFIGGFGPFFGIVWITIFGGSFATIGLTALTAILQIVFISLSHFKNGKYKYVALAVWIVLLILNIIFVLDNFDPITYASPIITVVLMVLSFLCAKKPEPTDEYQPATMKIATVIIAVILTVISMFILMLVFVAIGEVVEHGIGMKKYIENEVQTPASEEIADSFYSIDYEKIIGGWVMLDSRTAMLPYRFTTFKAYWIIENDPRFVIKAEYDTWNSSTNETPLVSKDFEYPNVLTDTVTDVELIDWYPWDIFDNEECGKLELTPEQAETFRDVAFSTHDENTDKERIKLNNDDWEFDTYGTIISRRALWSYNGIDAIYYVYGEIIKNKDGDYYICADFERNYTSYVFLCTSCEKIPDDIAEKIDAVFE